MMKTGGVILCNDVIRAGTERGLGHYLDRVLKSSDDRDQVVTFPDDSLLFLGPPCVEAMWEFVLKLGERELQESEPYGYVEPYFVHHGIFLHPEVEEDTIYELMSWEIYGRKPGRDPQIAISLHDPRTPLAHLPIAVEFWRAMKGDEFDRLSSAIEQWFATYDRQGLASEGGILLRQRPERVERKRRWLRFVIDGSRTGRITLLWLCVNLFLLSRITPVAGVWGGTLAGGYES